MNLRQLFLTHVAQTSDAPVGLQIKKAKGIHIIDLEGKRYIDLISGISVNNIGHRNPAVLEAIRKQSSKYLHTMVYGEHIQHPQVTLAQKLTRNLPPNLESVYFTNSGAEATEGAMKLAKRFTGRSEIISMQNAYHGHTQGAMSLMSDEEFTAPFRPLLPSVKKIGFNNLESLKEITFDTACVFTEVIQSETGYVRGTEEFLAGLNKRCKEVGALLVIDEIQTGFGRTGKLFAFEHFSLIPDIVLLAKGMGGGMPIGCFIASKKVMGSLTSHPVLGHLTTFGGHPVNCAAAGAALDFLFSSGIMDSIDSKERLFRKYLSHKNLKELSGKGLLLSLDLGSEQKVQKVINICFEKGLLIDWFLFNAKALRIAPPLIIKEGEIKKVCKIILDAIEQSEQ
ncbi:MAG: aspartate aminotransferase family protein [Flavobacteriales bacterium]|nr:aspartate aminotransferase family protein [Flavobacteriales bacterium]